MKKTILALVALISIILPCSSIGQENSPGYYTYTDGSNQPDTSLSALTPQWAIIGDLAILCQPRLLKTEEGRKDVLDGLDTGTWEVVESTITIRDGKSTGTLTIARVTQKPLDPAIAVISRMNLTSEDVAELASTKATITFKLTENHSLGAQISGDRGYVYNPQIVTNEEDLTRFLKK